MTTATAPALRVVRGQDMVEVFGEARLSLTPDEARDLADDLRKALGDRPRRPLNVVFAYRMFRIGIRAGEVRAERRRARGAR